jgi:Ca2+-transporting ATPase
MITGDNKLTAEAIGKELGFKGMGVTGNELDNISENELKKMVEEVAIYARTSPKHKARILDMLKANNHIVAMTGDGVNDAPALVKSDVGIAMGIRGTEVAKQASDMILLDDNFVSIRNSIELGRGIFENIRKFVAYLLGANFAEVLVVFLAAMLNLGLPLLAAHLLWIIFLPMDCLHLHWEWTHLQKIS